MTKDEIERGKPLMRKLAALLGILIAFCMGVELLWFAFDGVWFQ